MKSTVSDSYPFLRGNYNDLPLNSPERPIQVIGTVQADVPSGSRRFLDHRVDEVQFPNGKSGWHHRLVIPHGVMLAHVDRTDSVALVKNFRHPLGRDSVELPSGGVDETISSLTPSLDSMEAARIVQNAGKEGKSILEYLTPIQAEKVLRSAAARETREEIGIDIDPNTLERLIPGPLRGSVGYAGQSYNIFYGSGGNETATAHDDGEAGMLKAGRVAIEDAGEMIGYEIVDPASATAISALALMYGKKPSWLPKRHS